MSFLLIFGRFISIIELCLTNVFSVLLQAEDIFKLHDKMCPRSGEPDGSKVMISLDGVAECKSTSVSIDVYSTKMKNCRMVYPHRLVRPLGKYKGLDNQEQLKKFLDNIKTTDKCICNFVGDNPKRSIANNALSHSSWHPCEYCFARGVAFITTNAQNQRRTKITWPASTANGEPRTREKIQEIVDNIEHLSPREKKGVVGKSLLFDIPNYNVERDSPAEYLHSCCLGLVKKCVELTFAVGENRPRITNRRLTNTSDFNKLMLLIKSPHEFSRRARELDFAVLKGAEFRNLALFFFPLIVNCIEEEHEERKLWLFLGFILRSCTVPSEEFRYVSLDVFESCLTKFYKLYEKLFGAVNCTYNTHVVGSHLPEIRAHGPLTETSAFPFESFYGEMKNCFVPGTVSPLKQIFQKVLLKRALSSHCCEIPIHYSDHETSLENDTLIYIWQSNRHDMYKIVELLEDGDLLCHKIEKMEYEFDDVALPWKTVGLFELVEINETEHVIIDRQNVSGKVIQVNNLLITCPNNVLREK